MAEPDRPAGRQRLRLCVALLIDSPVSDEIDGLRRALGDAAGRPPGGAGRVRIPPHITLVPPVNMAAPLVPAALATLRAAAAAVRGPLEVSLGPVTTFAPANPVLYLRVGGDLDHLSSVRDAAFRPPFERKLSRPWVPHVTVARDASADRITAAVAALDCYAAVTSLDRVVLLALDEADRRWMPLADAAVGPPAVVGTGGLALELTAGRLVDPEGMALLEDLDHPPAAEERTTGAPPGCGAGGRRATVVVSGRREGHLVGLAVAWMDDSGGHVAVAVQPATRRQGVGGHLLAAVEAAVDRAGWRCARLAAVGPAGFYRARSARARVT